MRADRRPAGLAALFLWALAASSPASAAGEADQAEIRVQLSPIRQTVLSAGMAGRIVEMDLREGDHVQAGDRLVAFDCGLYQAQLNRVVAAEAGARKKLDIAKRLEKLESISQLEVAQAEAAQGMASAEIGVQRAMLKQCAITAPFAGRVAARKVQRWDYVGEGKELLSLYDDSAYELELVVPSRWLSWVKPGLAFSVRLDETGTDYPAKISRIGAVVDPLNQSVKVFGVIAGNTGALLTGMSGAATLTPPPRK